MPIQTILLKTFSSSGAVLPNQMVISNRTAKKLDVFKKEGMEVTLDNMEVLKTCGVVFLGVKPYVSKRSTVGL